MFLTKTAADIHETKSPLRMSQKVAQLTVSYSPYAEELVAAGLHDTVQQLSELRARGL